jgi:hypothetical protein
LAAFLLAPATVLIAQVPPAGDHSTRVGALLTLEAAWTAVARVILNLDDFLTRE